MAIKHKNLNIRLTEETYNKFTEWCDRNETTKSAVINDYILSLLGVKANSLVSNENVVFNEDVKQDIITELEETFDERLEIAFGEYHKIYEAELITLQKTFEKKLAHAIAALNSRIDETKTNINLDSNLENRINEYIYDFINITLNNRLEEILESKLKLKLQAQATIFEKKVKALKIACATLTTKYQELEGTWLQTLPNDIVDETTMDIVDDYGIETTNFIEDALLEDQQNENNDDDSIINTMRDIVNVKDEKDEEDQPIE